MWELAGESCEAGGLQASGARWGLPGLRGGEPGAGLGTLAGLGGSGGDGRSSSSEAARALWSSEPRGRLACHLGTGLRGARGRRLAPGAAPSSPGDTDAWFVSSVRLYVAA